MPSLGLHIDSGRFPPCHADISKCFCCREAKAATLAAHEKAQAEMEAVLAAVERDGKVGF